ncbi:MAG: pilus assembly protein TadG-related protein [Stenotrophobium sp.]
MRRTKPRQNGSRPTGRQAGAVAVFVAISLVAILAAVTLSIDIGRLYYAQRDLQRLATLSALSAAQLVSGCANGTPGDITAATAEVNTIIALNNPAGTVIGTAGVNGSPYVELGTVKTATDGSGLRGFKPLTAGDPNIDSVRVNLSATAPSRLLPLFGAGGGSTLYASATATQNALGSLRVGSGVAALNGGLLNSLLSGLLGGNVNLTVANYNGLANVNVTASQLATALGISVTDLSDPTTLNKTVLLGTALSGLTGALSGGVVDPQVISTLQTLAGQANNTTPIPLGSILSPVGNVAGDVPFANLQDVLMALAFASQSNAAGGPQPIQLNDPAHPTQPLIQLPGVANVSVFAKVISPPTLSGLGHAGALTDPGTAQASTAQVMLMIRIDGSGAGNLLSLLNLINIPFVAQVTAVPNLKIGIDVGVAKATAWLSSLACPKSGVNNGLPIAGPSVNTALATVAVGTYNNLTDAIPVGQTSASIPLASVTLLGIPLANLALAISSTVGATTPVLNPVNQFNQCNHGNLPSVCDNTGPPDSSSATTIYRALGAPGAPTVPAPIPATENPQNASSLTSIGLNLGLTGGNTLAGAVLAPITALVTPLLNLVNSVVLSTVVNPLLNLLGVGVGNATVTMDAVTVARPAVTAECLPGVAPPRGCPVVP